MKEEAFTQVPLFHDLTQAQLALLRPLFLAGDCNSGGTLFDQGDPAKYLYIVTLGEVVIRYKPEDGPPITVANVYPGGVVGWSAAIGRSTYTSAAECLTYTQLLRIHSHDLQFLCSQHPETGALLLERLASNVAERYPHAHAQVVALLEKSQSIDYFPLRKDNNDGYK